MNNEKRESELEAGRKERKLIEAARRLNEKTETHADSIGTNPESATVDFVGAKLVPGTEIEPYKLLEKIGEGGFGVVYSAEQKKPIRRKVALKIIKPGMDTREVIARFEAERQALALMDHPNIARVLDAGATQSGHPYFVMELVSGIRITDYCDQQKMPIRQRLELFSSICHAIQHAHQKGIIHRDIKPSNVLVERRNDVPVPKVIDFGVAKATNQQLSEHTVHTLQAQMIGTPLYMSPEQAAKSGLDVDTRTDIYSLGVLLYELLTGTTPVDRSRLQKASAGELVEMICNEDATKPSTRIDESTDSDGTVALHRGSAPAKLRQLLCGDLDWIVIKALEKDRVRRYQTATDFARDVQRFLNDEPVSASPPSAVYRLRKFARRNKVAFVAGSVVFFSLLIATVVSSAMALRAIRSEERAQKSHDAELETRNQLDAVQKQALATEKEKTQMLKISRENTDKAFEKSLQILNEAMVQVGTSGLDDMPRMQQLRREILEKATVQYESIITDIDWEGERRYQLMLNYAGLLNGLARIRRWVGADKDAIDAYQKGDDTLAMLEATYMGHRSAITTGRASLKYGQGLAMRQIAQDAEAEKAFRQSIDLAKQATEEFPIKANLVLCRAHNQLGYLLAPTSRWKEAEPFYREAVNIGSSSSQKSPDDLEVNNEWARAIHNLAIYLRYTQRLQESDKFFSQALTIYRDLFKREDANSDVKSSLASVASDYAILLDQMENREKAVEMRQEALEVSRAIAAEFPFVPRFQWGLAICLGNIGLAEVKRGQYESAQEKYRECNEILRDLVTQFPDNPEFRSSLANFLRNRGINTAVLKDFQTAQRFFEESEKHWQILAENQTDNPLYQIHWGKALEGQARSRMSRRTELRHGVELADQALRHFDLAKSQGPDSAELARDIVVVWSLKAEILGFHLGDEKEAIVAAAQAAHYADLSGQAKRDRALIYRLYCFLLVGSQDESLRNPSKAIEFADRFISDIPDAASHRVLGIAYFRNGDFEKSLASLTSSREMETSREMERERRVYTRLYTAMTYQKLARNEEARNTYDQALELLKDFNFEACPQHSARQLKALADEAGELLSIDN